MKYYGAAALQNVILGKVSTGKVTSKLRILRSILDCKSIPSKILKSNKGITGIEVLAFSFLGSLICAMLVGGYIGWKTSKYFHRFDKSSIDSYQEIHQLLGNTYDTQRSMRQTPWG